MTNPTHFIEVYRNVRKTEVEQTIINDIIYLEDYLYSTILSNNSKTIAIFKIKLK